MHLLRKVDEAYAGLNVKLRLHCVKPFDFLSSGTVVCQSTFSSFTQLSRRLYCYILNAFKISKRECIVFEQTDHIQPQAPITYSRICFLFLIR